jgi:hypothetical protein
MEVFAKTNYIACIMSAVALVMSGTLNLNLLPMQS